MVIITIIFVLYLAINIGIGFIFYKKTDDMSDYLLGGRKLNSWVTAMSAQASDMSGWLLIGLPGTAYAIFAGTEIAIWTAIGLMLGTYANWKFVAKRLREYTEVAGNSLTIPDFFENRFHDKKHIIRLVSAIFIVIFFLVYTSSQFASGGKLFSTIFGIDYKIGLLIGAGVVLIYTAIGGFQAVCWTDTFQGILMFFALIIVPIIAAGTIGGWEAVAERLASMTPETLGLFPKTEAGHFNLLVLASSLGWGLGYFGQPHILVRFMAIESPEMIKKSRIIAMFWVVITLTAAVFIGVIGRAIFPSLEDPETVFMVLINTLFHPVVSGILMTAILASIMSTASSQLLVTSSSVTRDLYAVIFKKTGDGNDMVWISRLTVVFVSALAILLAINPDSSVFELVAFAWGGIGAAFGPLLLFALFWRRMTLQGAIAGMIVGGLVDIGWYFIKGSIFDIYEIIPAFIAASIAIIIVSLKTEVDSEITEQFDKVRETTF
jgi:sodium/proline symporter